MYLAQRNIEKLAMQDNRPAHFPPALASPFSINGEEKTLINMFRQAVHKVLNSSKFTPSAGYQRNASVENNGMTSRYQMDELLQTGVCGGGSGHPGAGQRLEKAVALRHPARSEDGSRTSREPLAANLHLALFLWITAIKTKSSLRKVVPQDQTSPPRGMNQGLQALCT